MASKKTFTPEELKELNANPFTHKASENVIHYTVAFKEFYYSKVQEGKLSNAEIFRAAGYDPAILGPNRMGSTREVILKEAQSPEGFKAPRSSSYQDELQKEKDAEEKARSADAKIQYLEERVTKLEAQIEFLKKTAHIRKQYQEKKPE